MVMWREEKLIDQMEKYYTRAKNLEAYCNKKGKDLIVCNGSLNYLSHSIEYDRDNNEVVFYSQDKGGKSTFFVIDLDMLEEKRLYFKCDRKYFALELGIKIF